MPTGVYKRTTRPIIVDGELAYIPLTKGLFSLIDTESIPLVQGYNWHLSSTVKEKAYAVRGTTAGGIYQNIFLHRVILSAPDDLQVDHINRDRLDNRLINLRLATGSQNQQNIGLRSNNASGYKGVCYVPGRKKWLAHITINYKQRSLGLYPTPEEAYAVYCKASKELHGDFSHV